MVKLEPVTHSCTECSAPLTRSHQLTCSARCRKRRQRREAVYVITDEDRAAIRLVLERDGSGHPLDAPLTSEEIRRHVALSAVRT